MFKDYNKYLKTSLKVYIFVLLIIFISDKYKICYDFFIKKENAISLGYKYNYTEAGIRKITYRINEKIKALD